MFCFHDRLKTHTFADGTVVQSCPDCTKYDRSRKSVLHVESKLKLTSGTPSEVKPEHDNSTITLKDSVYDHDWATKQKPFPHSHPIPRAFNSFCVNCAEMVIGADKVVRITRGVYLPIEHQCNSVRVYDLAGKLLEVKSL